MADRKEQKVSKTSFSFERTHVRVLELLLARNAADISYSMVARATKSPRSTLYYYFGKDISALLQESVRFGMKQFVRLWTVESIDLLKKYPTWDSLQNERLSQAVALVAKFPYIPGLYFRYRHDEGVIGKEVRHYESEYLVQMQKIWRLYHQKPLDVKAFRLLTYARIGILWGFSQEANLWKNDQERVAEFSSRLSFILDDSKS